MKLLNITSVERSSKEGGQMIIDEDDAFRLSSYIHRSCGFTAKNNTEEKSDDHSYVRATNCRPDFVFAKPMRTLLVRPPNDVFEKDEEIVDVETFPRPLPPVYDVNKGSNLMEDCERHVNFQHPDEGNPEWEDNVPRINWTNLQARLFNKIVRVLHNDRLARLAHQDVHNEPVLRRITVDKTARRMRQIFASVTWNVKYTQWLHNILMDNLNAPYLVIYLDAMQTLKSKVPVLVERMLAGTSTRSALATPTHELLSIVHKRPWDPTTSGLTHYRPKKLPQDPILVMVPSGPGTGNTSNSRTHHWMANLSALGTVVCVYSSPVRLMSRSSVASCLDHMLASTRAKVAELHADYGDRPIILVGIGPGASLACQVALVEKVTAVVCLGFPLYTAEDSRGTADDGLLNMQVPVLFVVGQNASTSSVDDMEDMREKLNVVSSMVLVGGADDQLRLTKATKKLNGVTQTIVDKCVMDEVGDFLGTLLSPGYAPPCRPTIVHHSAEPLPKRTINKTIERKRKCDILITNSQDGSAPPPVKKGRKPKISMMQKMVHNKWANQLAGASEGTRPSVPHPVVSATPSPQGIVLTSGKKVIQLSSTSPRLPTLAPAPAPTSTSATAPDSTITVVAASSPSLNTVKSRLASGQLTSLSSILQPGTRGVLSSSSSSVNTDDSLLTVHSLNTSVDSSPIVDELNILDMPVILGDQNPEEDILPQPVSVTHLQQQTQQQTSPIKVILTNARKGVSAIKYLSQGQQSVKLSKIFISKADGSDQSALLLSEEPSSRVKPRIRHIPATKHTQFNTH